MLEHLDSNEAVLLMYLADELPPDDRAEFEGMLAHDAGLGAELDRLREAQGAFESAMERLDAAPLRGQAMAVQRITQAMRQHAASRPAAAPHVAPRRLRIPRWSYPTAAAAALIFGMISYWAHIPLPNVPQGPVVIQDDPHQELLADNLEESFENPNPVEPVDVDSPGEVSDDEALAELEYRPQGFRNSVFAINPLFPSMDE